MSGPIASDQVVQIGLVVRDIDKSKKRWAKMLGVPVPDSHLTDTVDKTNAKFRGKKMHARAKLAFFKLGQVSLELIEPVGGPSTWKEALLRHGESVHHIAFHVKDTEQVEKDFEKLGCRTEQKGDYTGGRYSYVDARKPLGVILEFLQDLR